MILKHKAELAGRVKLQISGGERGTIDYPWFNNMILDQGLRTLLTAGRADILNYFSWGSSSQPVQPTDTDLVSPLGRSNAFASKTYGFNASDGYGFTRAVVVIPRGVAAGNLSELAANIQPYANQASCRTLIKDASGNPTTITVLPDEVLTITWEMRKWWSVPPPKNITYTIDDVEHTTLATMSPFDTISQDVYSLGNGGNVSSGGGSLISDFTSRRNVTFTESQGNPAIVEVSPALPNRDEGSIFPYYGCVCTFTPPIPKTGEFKCDFAWELTLSRRAP